MAGISNTERAALTEREPLVIVPAHPGAGDQLIFAARREPDGLVLPVFSSVGVLVAALGRSQPWAAVPLAKVVDAASAGRVDLVVLNPEVSGDAWRWDQRDLGGFSWRQPT
jgi:hypothetical protein